MKQVTGLMLTLNPSTDLRERLRWLLQSSADPKIRLFEHSIGAGVSNTSEGDVIGLIDRIKPSIIVILFSHSRLEQTRRLLQILSLMRRSAPILIVAEHCEQEQILELLNLGAADFITQPLTATDLLARIKRLLEQTRKGEAFKRSLKVKLGLKQIIGDSPVFRKEIEKIPTVAQCDVTVLISGETGTGKELFARALHYLSPRAGRPFVPVNCGAIPTDLVGNELFGHEQGAYTGASKSQPGMIREADGGTLFLDEIDCLPQNAQIKLLRFLQEREYRPLGSTKVQQADVRVLAATNVDPEAALREGKVRQDLYYRLNVIPFVLPPLRQRREDISILARHFLKKYAAEFNKPARPYPKSY